MIGIKYYLFPIFVCTIRTMHEEHCTYYIYKLFNLEKNVIIRKNIFQMSSKKMLAQKIKSI